LTDTSNYFAILIIFVSNLEIWPSVAIFIKPFPESSRYSSMGELSSEQWKEVEEKFQSGVSIRELERQYPTSRVAVKKHLEIHGFKKKPIKPLIASKEPVSRVPNRLLIDLARYFDRLDNQLRDKLLSYLPKDLTERVRIELEKNHQIKEL